MLYKNYTPDTWYWEIIIVARKFLIALTALMFQQVASYELAMCLLVLFAAFVLQTQYMPYMTHANRDAVLEAHMAKALSGDKQHALIEAV